MITNLILSAFFLLPFEPSALGSAISDPIVGIVLCYCLAGPAIHAVMTRRLVISSWKLGGWGMYATTLPTISTVGPTGTLITQTTGSAPLGVLLTLGACRLRGLRTFAVRTFLRWHPDAQHVHGFVFAWLRRRRDAFVTQCVVIRTEGDTRDVFVLDDDARVSQFREHVIALATGKTCAPNPDRDAIEMPTGLAREHAR